MKINNTNQKTLYPIVSTAYNKSIAASGADILNLICSNTFVLLFQLDE